MHTVGNNPRNHAIYASLEEIFRLVPPLPAANLEPYYTGWNHVINRPGGETPVPDSDRDNYFARAQMYGSVRRAREELRAAHKERSGRRLVRPVRPLPLSGSGPRECEHEPQDGQRGRDADSHLDTSPSRDRLFPLPTQAYGRRECEVKGRSAFLELAEGLGLGVADRDKIKISAMNLG